MQVLLAVGNTIVTADIDGIETTAPAAGSIQKLAIAPNGQFVAGYTSEGKLKVWVSDFSKVLSEFATESKKTPLQLEWCGDDSVVLLWEVSISHVAPQGFFWLSHCTVA